ncbi:uncharacterized protein H6S33_002399 [Morchella sextelata]|uniref:uncharacterized protein n=1 Tax=Morchella sextelata TaxID=1174677 RepID=UPI001D0424ED|nr:uncharacterized protein H6S33_002399 [Morchella sextelata]KAH0607365.1 hypothetical protein H6S33_002399 [Morchella sextelata]
MPWAEPIKPYEKPAEVVRAEGFVPGTYLVDTLGPLRWTCRLKIFFDDSQNYARGSGFLVNLPAGSKKDLIMTAGHNLVNSEGKYAKSIEILFGGVGGSSIGSEETVVSKDKNEYFASRSYEKDPTENNAVNDYGCILLKKRVGGSPRAGFSYSVIMEEESILEKEATVYGYPAQNHDGSIILADIALNAFGKITKIDLNGKQLQYLITTEKGHSGGPVCVRVDDYYTAIGIHNYAGKPGTNRNCGSILTCGNLFEMLEHCYERTSIELYLPGSMGSSLEAQRNSNIFLKIPPGRRSRVLAQHGKDKYTQVNLIPVETYPVAFAGSGKETQIPKYIIATPHREPYIVLEFCTGSQNQTGEPPRPGMVINSTEEDLMHGRPTKRNLVELREVSTRVELVSDTTPDAGKYKKFFVNGID